MPEEIKAQLREHWAEQEEKERHWRVDKKVPLSLVMCFLGQIVILISWGSALQWDVRDGQRRMSAIEDAIRVQKADTETIIKDERRLFEEASKEQRKAIDLMVETQRKVNEDMFARMGRIEISIAVQNQLLNEIKGLRLK